MSSYTSSVLITGGTVGMGYHCSLSVAQQRPNTLIVIASRSNSNDAASTINKTLGQSNVVYMPLDLSSIVKVRDFAKRWTEAKHPPIDALVFNAGGQWPAAIEYTEDKIEKNFGVNHVGHALLFHLLAPHLQSDARIVVVGSAIHDPREKFGTDPAYTTPAEIAQPSVAFAAKHTGMERYSASKLANVAWSLALGSRFSSLPAHASKTVVAFDPGFMPDTGLYRNMPAVVRFVLNKVMPKMMPVLRLMYHKNTHSAVDSGSSLAWVAVSGEVKGKKGVYFEGRSEHRVGEKAGREEVQKELWDWTVERVAEGEEERRIFERVE
jgi:NAD(P)-dependent dehydrogenase (short-subunit alcohol dehydrogenase family)